MSFLGFFKTAAAKVSSAFKTIFGADAAQKFGEGALALLKTSAGVLATDAVALINTANPLATPAEKQKLAADKLVGDAKSQGIQLSSSFINLLIELAVQAIVKRNIIAA